MHSSSSLATFLLNDPNPAASSALPVSFRRGLCVQSTSGIDVARLHASICTAGKVIPGFPLYDGGAQ
jgi:hypothetical protein